MMRLVPRAGATGVLSLLLVLTTLHPAAAILEDTSLRFLAEPATTSVGSVISSVIGEAGGEPIKVAIVDAAGARRAVAGVGVRLVIVGDSGSPGATLRDATAETDAEGVAVFAPSIDQEGLGYRLSARPKRDWGPGELAPSGPSAPFDIRVGSVEDCSGRCRETAGAGVTQALVSAKAAGYLVVDVGSTSLDCRGYRESSDVVSFDVTQGFPGTRARVRIELEASGVRKRASRYDVCFSSPVSRFRDKSGTRVRAGASGLLADCPARLSPTTRPCVRRRAKDRDGDIVVVFSVPAGDPRGVI
jgi:hypothetical protein